MRSKTNPRAPTWDELLKATSPEEAKSWLKTETMIAFHRKKLSPATVEAMFEHFGLREA